MDFDTTFVRHHPAVFRYLLRLVGDADVAEDLAQETFVRLLRHPLPENEARAWLFAVATNLARDHGRERARHRRLLAGADLPRSGPPRPDEELARDEEIARVRRALKELSPRDREILLLREEGFRYAEIAEVVGVAPSSVGTLLARALRRFGRALDECEGGSRAADDGRNGGEDPAG